jgi:hypothetical protein
MSESTIPPAPPGWNKTISELVAETTSGLRKSVGPYEIEWARDYERSLLPADVRFPKEGDLYEALQDVQIDYLTSWAAPFTGSGKGILKKGERIRAMGKPVDTRPISIYLEAVDYPALEGRMVPESDRNDEIYCGFYFSVKTLDLNRKFKLVE